MKYRDVQYILRKPIYNTPADILCAYIDSTQIDSISKAEYVDDAVIYYNENNSVIAIELYNFSKLEGELPVTIDFDTTIPFSVTILDRMLDDDTRCLCRVQSIRQTRYNPTESIL